MQGQSTRVFGRAARANLPDVKPACQGCVLEARATVSPTRTIAQGAEAIAERMQALDLSFSDVCRRGIALVSLSRWLEGTAGVAPESRPRLAAALEMSQVELEALLPRPGRRSREPGADWRCVRHSEELYELLSDAEPVLLEAAS